MSDDRCLIIAPGLCGRLGRPARRCGKSARGFPLVLFRPRPDIHKGIVRTGRQPRPRRIARLPAVLRDGQPRFFFRYAHGHVLFSFFPSFRPVSGLAPSALRPVPPACFGGTRPPCPCRGRLFPKRQFRAVCAGTGCAGAACGERKKGGRPMLSQTAPRTTAFLRPRSLPH